jgi:hypothetical protein
MAMRQNMVEVKNAMSPQHPVRTEAEVEHPNEENVDQRPHDHCVPDEGRNAGFHAVEPHPPVFEEIVVLAKRLGM